MSILLLLAVLVLLFFVVVDRIRNSVASRPTSPIDWSPMKQWAKDVMSGKYNPKE